VRVFLSDLPDLADRGVVRVVCDERLPDGDECGRRLEFGDGGWRCANGHGAPDESVEVWTSDPRSGRVRGRRTEGG
jgi:hypothetical protein